MFLVLKNRFIETVLCVPQHMFWLENKKINVQRPESSSFKTKRGKINTYGVLHFSNGSLFVRFDSLRPILTPVTLESGAPRSRVKQSTTEPLPSH